MSPHYPWPTFTEPWTLDITDVAVDGRPRDELRDESHRRLRADLAEGWNELTFAATARKPDGATGITVKSVHLLVSSPRSQTRIPVLLNDRGQDWFAEVRLPRALVAGAVRLVAEASAPNTDRARLVGTSEEWTVLVDKGEAPLPPGAPPFTMAWIDFGAADAPLIVRENADVLAVMDLAASPVLYLNAGIEGFQEVVHNDHARGKKRQARDMLGSEIARHALTTMVRAGAGEVIHSADGDQDPEPPVERLQRQSLEAVARAMPGMSGLDDLCDRIVHAERGPFAERATLWAGIDAGIARLCDVASTASELCKGVRFV